MIKPGKKTIQWQKDRVKLIKEAVANGVITIKNGHPEGFCADCGEWHPLDPDHRLKRSQGGSNDYSNIDWVCRKCHDKRDNLGDPMNKKEKSNGGKANWQKPHACKHCKQTTSMLLCQHCKKISV